MDRLTRWNGKKWILPQGRRRDGQSYWRIIAERLAEYENLGYEPEELREILRRCGNGEQERDSGKESKNL